MAGIAIGQNARASGDGIAIGVDADQLSSPSDGVIAVDSLFVGGAHMDSTGPTSLVLRDPSGTPVQVGIDAGGHVTPAAPASDPTLDAQGRLTVVNGTGTAGGLSSVVVGANATGDGVDEVTAVGPETTATIPGSIALGGYSVVQPNALQEAAPDFPNNCYGSIAIGALVSGFAPKSVAIGWVSAAQDATIPTHPIVAIGTPSSSGADIQHEGVILIGDDLVPSSDDVAMMRADTLEVVPWTPGASAVILRSPNGSRWSIAVSDAGAITATAL